MERINVVLLALNEKSIQQALFALNPATVNLVAIVTENGNRVLKLGATKFPLVPFSAIPAIVNQSKNFVWLICGFVNNASDIYRTKKFLMTCGVPEDNIINFERMMSTEWLANLRYIEKYGADFFATGISYTEVGLNLHYIPQMRLGGGVNLSGSNQDLLQGYLTAKYVFEHVKPGTIKFVIIGLAPYSFRYENAKAFTVCTRHLQYMLALNAPARNNHDRLLQVLISDNVKKFFASVGAEQADLNFDRTKNSLNREMTAKDLVNWENELKNLTKKLFPESVEKNFQILKDYIRLCTDHGAKPVGVVFPFAAAMHDKYSKELLTLFRLAIRQLEDTTEFTCVDLFDLRLGYDCFYNMANLNIRGASIASTTFSFELYKRKILPLENFLGMNYEYFDLLSKLLPKDAYNALMSDVFKLSAERMRGKNKIRVGFVTDNAAMWCGDKLYNYFARDKRFEPTVFLCLQRNKSTVKTVIDDFHHGTKQFKSRGLNVFPISDPQTQIPKQDVIFFLRPYFNYYPDAFQMHKLTANTLIIHIPYGLKVSQTNRGSLTDYPIFRIIWKGFFENSQVIKTLDGYCKLGMPRGLYSGLPKLDAFFADIKKIKFDWKMTQRNAKKIIWAPHWSINGGAKYATFQWNWRFMYEFAKAHPETSWVVKPHPHLLHSAVESGVFSSTAAFEEYLKAWNDLPNAQVYTGAYYHAIFTTSDGMILDSGSFIGEYQYVHKPMIFLTRESEQFNEIGREILNVSYLVDGRDLNGIAKLMQKIFIEGGDPKRSVREEFFDKYLNYYKHNGMTASEFIYKNIRDELES